MFRFLQSIRKAFRTRRQTARPRVQLRIEQLDARIVPSTIPNLTNAHFALSAGGHAAQLVVTAENTATGGFGGYFTDPTIGVTVGVSGSLGAEAAGSTTADISFTGLTPIPFSPSGLYGVNFGGKLNGRGKLNGTGTNGRFYGGDQLTGGAVEYPSYASPQGLTVTGNDYAPVLAPPAPKFIGTGVLSASVAFDSMGHQVQAVVFTSGQLWIYDTAGAHFIGSSVLSAGVAFNPSGQQVLDVVFAGNNLYSYDASGSHFIGSGVQSVGVSFDNLGRQETAVVYTNGSAYLFDAAGPHLVAPNVKSMSVAFDSRGNQVLDLVYADSTLYQFDSSGSHYIGSGVQAAGVGFDYLGQRVLDAVFASSDLWEY